DQPIPCVLLAYRRLSNRTLTRRNNILILTPDVLERIRVEIQIDAQLARVARNVFQLVNRLAVDLVHARITDLRVSAIEIEQRPRRRQYSTNQAVLQQRGLRAQKRSEWRAPALSQDSDDEVLAIERRFLVRVVVGLKNHCQ